MKLRDRKCILQFLVLLAVITNEVATFNIGEMRSMVLAPVQKLVARYKRQASTNPPDITDMLITSEVRSRFATVKVSSVVVNSESKGLEASFSVQIPETAFVSNFTMLIGDKLYVGKVYEKKVAQKKYDKAKQQGQSAGQVKHVDRNIARAMDVFQMSINVAANSSVHFELTYQELLQRKLGLYVQRLSVQPLQIVNNLTLDLTYSEPQDISRFEYRLPHKEDIYQASSPKDYARLEAGSDSRRVVFTPPATLQRQVNSKTGIDGELVVSYDVTHPFDGGNIVAVGNYFVHYFAVDKSNEVQVQAKNIIFVIDISGSMSGRKIEQTRTAMLAILPQLNDIDYFNIMLFDNNPTVWQTNPIRATENNIVTAQAYVKENVEARGGTNINSAMLESVKLIANAPETVERVGVIVFLTDGVPTSGETQLHAIRQNIKNINENRVTIFCLGFGQGVNFKFLSQISFENNGFPRRIYEESDAAKQLEDFYKEISNPVCRDVQFQYKSDQVVEADLSQTKYKSYYSGSEIVVVGKRRENLVEAKVVCLTKEKSIELVVPPSSSVELSEDRGEYVRKLYAYKTIKHLLMMMSITDDKEEAARLEAKALNMSLSFNFVTPLTSLVIIQEQKLERSQLDIAYGQAIGAGPTCHLDLLLVGILALTTVREMHLLVA